MLPFQDMFIVNNKLTRTWKENLSELKSLMLCWHLIISNIRGRDHENFE